MIVSKYKLDYNSIKIKKLKLKILEKEFIKSNKNNKF
jgi:hypothetical protein